MSAVESQLSGSKIEQVLIYDKESQEIAGVLDALTNELPDLSITKSNTLAEYQKHIKSGNFDIVIVNHDLSPHTSAELIKELQLKEFEPAVLLVSSKPEPESLSYVCSHGAKRYLQREGDRWRGEIGPALRQLLRIRKLEQENRNLLAKLTEANMMLVEKNRRLDEFSATLAHDIRGPLGGICMKLEYVLDKHSESLSEKTRTLLSTSRDAADRLTRVIQAMYDFAKLGAKAAKMEDVNLKDLVHGVVSDLSFDESLDITIGIDELPHVWGNNELLQRVFLNLISNAVTHNDKKQIIINVGLGEVIERSLGTFVEIYVQDNGPGISEDEQKQLFNITNKLSRYTSKTGLGIGLSVVQRVAELHYGSVRVESNPDNGSRFVITLPINPISF